MRKAILSIALAFAAAFAIAGASMADYYIPLPNHNATAEQGFASQEVFTGGRWGNDVPVFRSRGAYYSARYSMDRERHYRRQSRSVACRLKIGTKVEFKPFRDWGVGEVKSRNCNGWIDRAVIR